MSTAHQARLLKARVLIVGELENGLLAQRYLKAAGVGSIDTAGEFDAHNAEEIFGPYQLVLDALSGWQEKLLASDICMHLKKTLVHSACSGFNFQVFTMVPGKSACLRCVLCHTGQEDLPRQSNSLEVFQPMADMAAIMQACEAIKVLSHLGVAPAEVLLQYDAFRREFSTVTGLGKRADCPDCGGKR